MKSCLGAGKQAAIQHQNGSRCNFKEVISAARGVKFLMNTFAPETTLQ